MSNVTPIVSVIMGSDSDLPVMGAAAEMLEYFSIPHEVTIVSAHRTPARLYQYAYNAEKNGLRIIIAGAGGAAHLPGMVAAITPIPVIGVPVKNSALNGEDSLLSIVQMPPGVPVATMAINGAKNAGILAALLPVLQCTWQSCFSLPIEVIISHRTGYPDFSLISIHCR